MTVQDIGTLLTTTGLPVSYYSFAEKTTLPCICYFETGTDNFGADNIAYTVHYEVAIELYTKTKNFDTEKLVENLLTDNGIYWDKESTYLDDEKCYETIYTINI